MKWETFGYLGALGEGRLDPVVCAEGLLALEASGLEVWGTEEAASPPLSPGSSAQPNVSPRRIPRTQTLFYLLGRRDGSVEEAQDPEGESPATVRRGKEKVTDTSTFHILHPVCNF